MKLDNYLAGEETWNGRIINNWFLGFNFIQKPRLKWKRVWQVFLGFSNFVYNFLFQWKLSHSSSIESKKNPNQA